MFPKGTVTAAVTPAEKPPVTPQKDPTVVYMVNNTDAQVDAVNEPYWRTQRARICACAVVLTTFILVAGTLGAIVIVLSHTNGVETTEPHTSLNRDREPLLGNEVPLPKLPEATIRIKIDDGGLMPPTEPTTPDLIGYVSSSLSEDFYLFSSQWSDDIANSSPMGMSQYLGSSSSSEQASDAEVSGDDQEGSGKPDPEMTEKPSVTILHKVFFASSSW